MAPWSRYGRWTRHFRSLNSGLSCTGGQSLAGVGVVFLLFVAGLWALTSGLPGRDELRTLGEMPQATTLYDVHNRPVFTIFKEYRIEVPLAQVSPHLRQGDCRV